MRRSVIAALVYAGFGTVWILISDQLVGQLFEDIFAYEIIQTGKGLAFIALSALFVFLAAEWARQASRP